MKKSQLVLLLFINTFLIQAQQIISTTGDYQANSSVSLSWTLGECVINTDNSSNVILTQGFQQSKQTITSIQELQLNSLEISAYPNPTQDIVTLKVKTELAKECKFQLYDLNGKILAEQKIAGKETKISFNNRPSGTYIIKLINKDQVQKVLKINKQ
jgi:hypothetical protein